MFCVTSLSLPGPGLFVPPALRCPPHPPTCSYLPHAIPLLCADKDCAPDNKECCSSNKKTFTDDDGSGFLLDIETHALKSVWGYDDGHNWLVAPAWYRM